MGEKKKKRLIQCLELIIIIIISKQCYRCTGLLFPNYTKKYRVMKLLLLISVEISNGTNTM